MGKALLNVDLAGQDLQALSGARTAGGAESQHRRSYNPGPESDGAGEGIEHSGSVCEMRNMGNHRVDGGERFATYLTRFCVHSRSRLVSRATLTPSEKFERAPFRRRWASACSSMSSRCLAFNWPELLRAAVLVLVRADLKTREISRLFTSIEISKAEYILTFALAWQVPGPMAWGQKCPACGHSEHRQRRLPNTIQCWTHSRR